MAGPVPQSTDGVSANTGGITMTLPCECEGKLNKPGPIDFESATQLTKGTSSHFKPSFKDAPACKGEGCEVPKIKYEWIFNLLDGQAAITGPTNTEQVAVDGQPGCEFELTVTVKVECRKKVGAGAVAIVSHCEDSGSQAWAYV
jgi:hypothetical protein